MIRDALNQLPLAPAYSDEQRDLQPHIQRALEESLRRAFPAADLRVTISIGGTGKPNLRLFGTSFWADVEITQGGVHLAAIEVKLIRVGQRSSKPIAEALGQSLVYSIRYPYVFTFIAHYGPSDDRLHGEDKGFEKRLSQLNVKVMIRKAQPELTELPARDHEIMREERGVG